MSIVILDTGPLGLLCHPRPNAEAIACRDWVDALRLSGHVVILPEIAHYEYRRESKRRNSIKSLRLLQQWRTALTFLAIDTAAMDLASDLWADVRQQGMPTASDDALDGDVILAAQALSLNATVLVASSNTKHLSRFLTALPWNQITP